MPLESVHYIHGSDGLPLGVLSVGDGITDDILQKYLKHTTGLFVDESRDTLHSTTTSETADSGLGDTLDVITQNLAMPLGAPLSESFTSLSTSSHVAGMCVL